MEFKYCKLEIFLPPTHLEVVQKALQEVDAGHIGNYDSCMSVGFYLTASCAFCYFLCWIEIFINRYIEHGN